MRRKFLAVFLLPKPQAEHARIEVAIRHHSGGDFKQAFMAAPRGAGGVIAYLFTSETPAWEMGFGLLNQDSVLVVELGHQHADANLNVARAWLKAHRQPGTDASSASG